MVSTNMKLLIHTQTLDRNADVLGFMHGWIRAFAEACDEVTVVALQVGEYDLPKNVRVFSLGKETRPSRFRYLLNFYRYLFRERSHYDHVLVHMNHEYVLLGGFFWRLMGKRIGLWYAHGHVPYSLHVALWITHVVLASTKSGFRIPSSKLQVIGQGIDVDQFSYVPHNYDEKEPFRIIVTGRISPVKDIETLVRAVKLLVDRGRVVTLDIVGDAGTDEQRAYVTRLKELVTSTSLAEYVRFLGAVPNIKIQEVLRTAHLFVNNSRTGSLDKTMVEAMSTGLPTLSSNVAMKEVFGDLAGSFMFPEGDHEALAVLIEKQMLMSNSERAHVGEVIRDIVVREHSLRRFVSKIVQVLGEDPS